MAKLVILAAIAFVTASCSKTSTKENYPYQLVSSSPKWIVYKLDENQLLCVPNVNADNGTVPIILEIQKK